MSLAHKMWRCGHNVNSDATLHACWFRIYRSQWMVGRMMSPKAMFNFITCDMDFFNQNQACENKSVVGKIHRNAS